MLIKGATEEQIHEALAKANQEFDSNLEFNNFEYIGHTRGGMQKHRVTLRVIDSRGKGARLGFPNYTTGRQRHLVSACWHVHGTFFDALPEGTTIQTGQHTIEPGDSWNDWDIGSMIRPMYYSEACEC